MRSSVELRESFLKFFEGKGHLRMPSFSLIPVDDPTLLLIGAGMAPFKPAFRGEVEPPHARITTCQKCIRSDDIERVGRTTRHHTFFEMLGNFSFGDYYKKESIMWAWEYVTEALGIPKTDLWVTIHTEDDEAEKLWRNTGVSPSRIVRMPDNFWGPIGLTGPCGPCSEILCDRGEKWGCGKPDCGPGCDCDRFIELWNLVFTGLNKDERGKYVKLPKQCIDTGLGFERLVTLMQDLPSPYETDLFQPLMRALQELTGHSLGENPQIDVYLRIVADHARAVVFMGADGITPGNEGRDYVMRRILRRTVRFGHLLGVRGSILPGLADTIVSTMGKIYPELEEKKEFVSRILEIEERNFQHTLDLGQNLLEAKVRMLKARQMDRLPGEDAFQLYDTYGFPLDLTREILAERGLLLDEEGFSRSLEEQRARARADQEEKLALSASFLAGLGKEHRVEFTGYEETSTESTVVAILVEGRCDSSAGPGATAGIVLDRTPFYAESGGQMGDTGVLLAEDLRIDVLNTVTTPEGVPVHKCMVAEGQVTLGKVVRAVVDNTRRWQIKRHHTATHILQAALREVLGKHVSQMGSLVASDRLRFDFSHHCAVSDEEIEQIEAMVNEKIMEDIPVKTRVMELEEAIGTGALAFFAEKYSKHVRVVSIGDFSKELCGGTHVTRTGEIGSFKLIGESAVGTGLRRLEAVAGTAALRDFQNLTRILKSVGSSLKAGLLDLPEAVLRLREREKGLLRQVNDLEQTLARFRAEDLLKIATDTYGSRFVCGEVPGASIETLRRCGDFIRDRLSSGVILLTSSENAKVSVILMVTPDLVKKGIEAGEILKEIAPFIDGKGGGRSEMAQGGGKNPEGIIQAVAHIRRLLQKALQSEEQNYDR